jgi:anaerobic magnesium-protoporphyrin IX monomethyl ester cyclase
VKNPVLALISLYTIENNGVRSIAAFLRQNNFEVYEIYLKDYINHAFIPPTETEYHNLLKILKDKGVNLAGLSVRASAYAPVAVELSRRIKAELNLPILWGGMHPTFLPENCLEAADYICLGEAEEAMLEFMQAWPQEEKLKTIKNFWINTHGRIIKNELRPLLQDLDYLPLRDFHSRDYKYYLSGTNVTTGDPYIHERVYTIMASRGCPFACTFCDASILKSIYKDKGNFYRLRKPLKVIEELEYARKNFPNLHLIRFDDELFPPNKSWIEDFCPAYLEKIKLPFEIHLDPRNVHEDNLIKLKAAGLKSIFLGIQNTERINAELYNRHISNEKVLEAAHLIHKLNLRVCYQIILDDPVSTSKDKEDFFNFLLKIPRPYELFLFSLTYWPRSPLAQKLLQEGCITEDQLEDKAFKVFKQWRVDLSYERTAEDRFWISLIVLLSKNYIPKGLLKLFSRSTMLKTHPDILAGTAQFLNLLKMAWLALTMLLKGELSFRTIKMWLNFKSMVTS